LGIHPQLIHALSLSLAQQSSNQSHIAPAVSLTLILLYHLVRA
jgi:hypothetical protein